MLSSSSVTAAASRSLMLPVLSSSWSTQPFCRRLSVKKGDSIIEIPVEEELPERAAVVVAGAGLIGNSVAYHLAERRGWRDVVVLDRGNIADGTSKYGSGMLGMFRPTHERSIVQECVALYRNLQDKGFKIGLQECGSLNLAMSRDRMISLRRRANRYKPTGLDCQVLGPSEIKEFHPHLYTEDLQGGVWIPGDACVHPKKVSEALAFLAFKSGARFVGSCGVQEVLTDASATHGPVSLDRGGDGKVSGVRTDKGVIKCDYFVNCAGIWARALGKLSKPPVRVPIFPAEHFFLTYQEVDELRGVELPNVRDYDSHIYFRSWNNSLLVGAFEPKARPWLPGPGGSRWSDVTEEHWRHFAPYISAAVRRVPLLKEAVHDHLLNTPDAFTPDGRWIMGETPEVENYFVCAGMNGNSLQAAGGVGKVVADWIADGRPPGNMLAFEVQRFADLHNTWNFLKERTSEVVGRHYKLNYPLTDEFSTARGIRTSPIYSELQARGAVFGERMGWERPLYFEQYHERNDPPKQLPEGTFGKPQFYDNIEEEYLACREGVGIIDMSSFSKFQIKGDEQGVVNYLQFLCSNDVDIPVGSIISTGMHNEAGGYENDCMLVRKNKDTYFMVSPTQQQTRIHEWMTGHLPANSSVDVQDMTSMYTVLTVVGPKSKDLMQQMTNSDMSMHPFTYKYVNVGYASGVMAFAVTQTGEPGYSLYVKNDSTLQLYDQIMSVGQDYDIKNVGHLAMRFLRLEKFIPFWGEELTAETTPLEVGRASKVKFDKAADFLGRSKMLEQKERGVTKRLAQFQISNFDKDTDAWPWAGEALHRNGDFVGYVTNSAYGITLDKMVCLGFVNHPESFRGRPTVLTKEWLEDPSAKWEVNVAGRMLPATMLLRPPRIPSYEELRRSGGGGGVRQSHG